MMRTLLAVAMIAMPLATLAQQSVAQQSTIQLDHVWSRAALAGHEGAVYLTITDNGPPDTLTLATTPVAAMARLHETRNDNGVMKMRPVAALPIEPGKPVTLRPGSYHIMLTDLKQALTEGESFPITLTFAKAGQVTAIATVAKAGAATMPGMDRGTVGGMGNMPMQSDGKQP
jgi:copper(I)-binding protein